nr:MAG TPA: hypothetical protein [Caudoviricetes sp.]
MFLTWSTWVTWSIPYGLRDRETFERGPNVVKPWSTLTGPGINQVWTRLFHLETLLNQYLSMVTTWTT